MFKLSHSQNFLTDEVLVQKVIQMSSISKEDVVLDIGAGKGIITKELLSRCKKIEAIEKDYSLCQELKARFADCAQVNVRCADFMEYRLPLFPYKVFANIPYTITASVVKKLINAKNPPLETHLVIQREAAHKYTGHPYQKETLVSLIHKPWFDFKILYVFRKDDFKPKSNVVSVLLRIQKREEPCVPNEQKDLYKDFITYGFTTRKSGLRKALNNLFSQKQFVHLAHNLEFRVNARPTNLSFEQWLGLFKYFNASPESNKRIVSNVWQKLVSEQERLLKRHRTNRKHRRPTSSPSRVRFR